MIFWEAILWAAIIYGLLFGLPVAVNVVQKITRGRIKVSEVYKVYSFTI